MSLPIPRNVLVTPRALPDGSVSWEAEQPEIAARIRDGDSRFGWLGDERLSLVLNTTFAASDPQRRGLPRWEVWRSHEEGEPTLVVSCVRQRINGDQLMMQLAAHDTRTHDIAAEILDARGAHRDRLKREAHEHDAEAGDKLAWALGRDLSEPAQPGRVYPTS